MIQPPAILLIGAPGSGKTDVTATYTEAGLEVFVLITEPGGVESLIDGHSRRRLSLDKVHWQTITPAAAGWDAMEQMVQTIGSQSFEGIQSLKSGVGKDKTRVPAMNFLKALKDFKCERTGQTYGDSATWDHSRALVVDSLSGLSLMAMALTIGYKPAAHQGEWGVAMNFLEQILLKLTSDRRCFFSLTAHIERETDDISGATRTMASTLGRKLAPKIPRFFSEVVLAKRTLDKGNAKFTWSTADSQADLKNRALPVSAELTPSYAPIVRAFRERLKLSSGAPPSAPEARPVPSATPKVVVPNAPLTPTKATA